MRLVPHSTLRQCLTAVSCSTKILLEGVCYRWARHLQLFAADSATIHGAVVSPTEATWFYCTVLMLGLDGLSRAPGCTDTSWLTAEGLVLAAEQLRVQAESVFVVCGAGSGCAAPATPGAAGGDRSTWV